MAEALLFRNKSVRQPNRQDLKDGQTKCRRHSTSQLYGQIVEPNPEVNSPEPPSDQEEENAMFHSEDPLREASPEPQLNTYLPREVYNKEIMKVIRFMFIAILFLAVLISATMSKVTFVAIASKLYHMHVTGNVHIATRNRSESQASHVSTDTHNMTSNEGVHQDEVSLVFKRNNNQSLPNEKDGALKIVISNATTNPNKTTQDDQVPTVTAVETRNRHVNTSLEAEGRHSSMVFIQLVIILMVPQFITLARMLFAGIIGKGHTNYPWPSLKSAICGIFISILEAAMLTGFAIFVATQLSPAMTILLSSGIFLMTAVLELNCCCKLKKTCDEDSSYRQGLFCFVNVVFSFFAVFLQGAGISMGSCFLFYSAYKNKLDKQTGYFYLDHPWSYPLRVFLPVLIIGPLLSVLWSRRVKVFTFEYSYHSRNFDLGQHEGNPGQPASRRGGFLYAGVRLITIPFLAYGYMRILNMEVDIASGLSNWSGHDITLVIIQIVSSMLTFIFSLVALWTTVQRWAFTLPLVLSTPAAFGWYWLSQIDAVDIFPYFPSEHFGLFNGLALGAFATLWLGQLLALGTHIWKNPNHVLAREQSLLLSPYYDPLFIDSFLLLNRFSIQSLSWLPIERAKRYSQRKSAVFICSTMYREEEHEMRQMLASINRVAMAISSHTQGRSANYESHIFFDNATEETLGANYEGREAFHLNRFALQLTSLLQEIFGLSPTEVKKVKTPYGYRLSWTIRNSLPFFIHLKDNSKVKAKKRWSQVMYLNYIINYRMKEKDDCQHNKYNPHTTYILTTDADIDFKPESVSALLDFMHRDDSVGAVCSRTHPLGSGPLVWYQIFEYAFGHWFQKAAEHILGCVLCCPGCFSVFRVSALKDVLDTYQSSVTTASEFLTKDMGEDRWLCTLLVKKGWRLEYAALAKNYTFCPDSFVEFFKQRRRWIASTMANSMEVMANAKTIALNNDSISFIFLAYQLILIISTVITPGTIILVVASGLQSAYQLNSNVVIGVLIAVSIAYGIICVKASEKVQLNVAKALTVAFAIIMAIAYAGIVTQTVRFLEHQSFHNVTSEELPSIITIDAVYLWGFSLIIMLAGVLHIKEITSLLHYLWFILALPTAYLLLMIYSAANLNNRNWGTREVGSGDTTVHVTAVFVDQIKNTAAHIGSRVGSSIKKLLSRNNVSKENALTDENAALLHVEEQESKDEHHQLQQSSVEVHHSRMSDDVRQWLKELDCQGYEANFEIHGYTRFEFIRGMTDKDLQEIGIDRVGFRYRLTGEISQEKLQLFESGVPTTVDNFLQRLHLSEYLPLLKSEGYYFPDDMKNMLCLTRDDLKAIGVNKKAHLNMLSAGITQLRNITEREVRICSTNEQLQSAPLEALSQREAQFWSDIVDKKLKPDNPISNDELKKKLNGLRNNTLVAMLAVNALWLALLLTFNHLQYFKKFGIEQSALPVLFAVLYFGIIVIQFICLILHRIETQIHVLGRT